MRFVIIADTHIEAEPEVGERPRSNERTRRIVTAIAKVDPAFVIHLGDVVHPVPEAAERAAALNAAGKILGALPCPLLITPGNHDIGDKQSRWLPASSVQAEWYSDFRAAFGTDRSLEREGLRCVLLDGPLLGSGLAAETEGRAHFEDLLEGTRRTFVFTHYPPFLHLPDEPGHYDNLDPPAREWLLRLLERHRVEVLFAGHVHTRFMNRFGQTRLHVAPSTSFTRRDYSELFRIGPAAEYGRDDATKLGFLSVDVFAMGFRVHFHRLDEAASTVRPNERLGVFVRHPLVEEALLPANPPTGALQRRRVPNDHPSLAVGELGLGVLRLPADDLLDPAVRNRAALLAEDGVRFLILVPGRPSDELLARLDADRAMIMGLEAVLPEEEVDTWRAEPPSCPVPVRLAPLETTASLGAAGQRTQRVGFGFATQELDRLTELDFKRDEVFAGIVARVRLDEPVFPTLLRIVAAVSARELELTIDLDQLGETPQDALDDDAVLAGRAAEAAFAAKALPDAEILLDTLIDVDRGYYPRHGLLDRRCDLRSSGRAIRTVNALPALRTGGFAWSLARPDGGTINGYESDQGVELLVLPPAARAAQPMKLERLKLTIDIGAMRTAIALALDGREVCAARVTPDARERHTANLDPAIQIKDAVIIRLS